MAEWGLPTTYREPAYSDFLGGCASVRAVSEGDLRPFLWKNSDRFGAPYGAEWTDALSADELVPGVFAIFAGWFGLFPGFNLGVLIGHIAAGWIFYVVAQAVGCGRPWAFVTALAFGLAPYQFAESPHHNTCQYVWYVPLFLPVWRWVAADPGLAIPSRRFWQALAIGFVTGLQNPYFSNIFCQLVLIGGGMLALRKRSWAAVLPAFAIVGSVALAFLISNLDTLSYRWIHGPPAASPFIDRAYRWLDIYAFKIVDMFVPWITHRSSEFARFGAQHRQASILLDEEGCVYLGLFGIVSLLALVGVAIRSGAERRESQIPMAAWQVLWVVLMATTGGLNATVAAFTGFTLFRTTCRYGVVILAIVLLYAAERLTGWQEKMKQNLAADAMRILTATAVAAMCAVILWDQVPRAPTAEQKAAIAAYVAADREFVANMEAALPQNAMVFQLPVTTAGPVPGVTASDHFRPALYSTSLRFSVGGNVGREGGNWQKLWEREAFTGTAMDEVNQRLQLNKRNFAAALEKLRALGFSGLYVNRNGYPDGGKGIEETLKELGYTKQPIASRMGDLVCFVLEKE
jgi:phosphoglycerol transferase